MTYRVATFYKFVELPDYGELRSPLLEQCTALGICGTVLLAREGINATLAAPSKAVEQVLQSLQQDPRFADLSPRWSEAAEQPFGHMKVKLRPEIVSFGQPEIHPARQAGTYVAPADWNQLITEPDVLLVDTRNAYEVRIGSFQGAVDPQTERFRDFPDYVEQSLDPQQHRRVAMFCTGGIRCEKASAYLKQRGFGEVYHLQGGILNYLESVPPEESLWRGECFVFDERVAVGQGLEPGSCVMCQACGQPVSGQEQQLESYEPGVSCPHCSSLGSGLGSNVGSGLGSNSSSQ
jgi:UPF0176 protein